MICDSWSQKPMVLFNPVILILKEPFYILTITLLSLLLPLSFLLLARLFVASYFYGFSSNSITTTTPPQPISFIFSLFLDTNPTLLLALVSILSIATLVQNLTGKITTLGNSTTSVHQPRLYTAWIFLCTLQLCVCLGVEGSLASGVSGSNINLERNLFSRVVFFLGLYETMLQWSRVIVKPVVDNTVLGRSREERWVERMALVVSFGTLWWWRLRDEVESLVIVPQVKKELLLGVGAIDFVAWWLYYLTVVIGMVKIAKSLLWVGMVLICRSVQRNSREYHWEEDKV